MRILFATPAYWPAVAFGGPTWAAKELAEALTRRGHTVEVVTTSLRAIGAPPDSRTRTKTEMVEGVTIHYLATPLRYRWMGITPTLPIKLTQFRRPDVVHLLGYRDVVTTTTASWARLARVPYVFETLDMYVPRYRNVPLKRAFDLLLGRPVARHAALVVATSERERTQLVLAGLSPERVAVRPNGFPTPMVLEPNGSLRRRVGIDVATSLVLNVGRISFKKGLDLLLRAVAELPGVHLAIVGPDDGDGTLQALEALRDELSLSERVHFVGPTDELGPGAAYAEADVFVLPSRNESFGLVAAEAAAAGTAAVVTDRCGIAPLLDGRAALIVPCTVEGIRSGVQQLLDDGELRRRFGAGGRAVAAEMSWDAVAAQQVELYRRAAGVA
jgi:glycosyltransferase involved in cell wall biosynthesis